MRDEEGKRSLMGELKGKDESKLIWENIEEKQE
jgi:hypothetical protein